MDYEILLRQTGGKKIYVDPQEEEGFYLYPGEVRKAGLKDGMLLSQEDFQRLYKEYAVPRAKKRALGILSKKDMTQAQLVEKLQTSLHDSHAIAEAMAFVIQHGYVDDESYARDYIYFHKAKKSFRQMKEELARKGIERDLLENVFEEEGEQPIHTVRPLVEKYIRKFDELDYKNIQKICMHFGRKGYSLDMIRQIIEEIKTEN